MMEPIQLTSDQVMEDGVRCIIYGENGVGKTTVLATLPDVLILSCQRGLLSLRKSSVHATNVSSVEVLLEWYRWLSSADPNALQYRSIGIDGIHTIAEELLYTYKQETKDNRQAYLMVQDAIGNIFKCFRNLPHRNVFFTVGVEHGIDPVSRMPKCKPTFTGQKLSTMITDLVPELFYMGLSKDPQGNIFRYFQTGDSPEALAKDRSGALEFYETDPSGYLNLNTIINKILTN